MTAAPLPVLRPRAGETRSPEMRSQPAKMRQPRDDIHRTRRHPHDEAAELLIFQRRQAPGLCRLKVFRVPHHTGERDECSKQPAVNRGREHVQYRDSVAHRGAAAM